MNRRSILQVAAAAGIALAPFSAIAGTLDYAPGLVKERLALGETVFLDFKASWCSTCAAQARVIDRLKAQNPAYAEQITFVDVDWDLHKSSDLTRDLRVPRRSTLIALKGDAELGRLVAATGEADIKSLLDTALTN